MKTLVAVAQMTSTADKKENLSRAELLIEKAAKFGAKVVSLPENFAYLGKNDDGVLLASEPLTGPSISHFMSVAKKNDIWLSLGGFQEKIPEVNRVFNTHVIIDNSGSLIAIYRKIHLFSATLPDGNIYDEARLVSPGSEAVSFKSPYLVGGLSICYDLRFPSLYQALRKKGAEVVFVPAAFTETTGKAHWETLLRARAIETQSYIVASAQIGRHNEKRETHGHAMIIDPWGTPLAQCGLLSDLAVAEIDTDYVRNLRQQMPIFDHRRDFL